MKREKKIGYLVFIACLVFIISFDVWIITQNLGREEKVVEIWLPENYQIVNKIHNVYISISEVQLSGKIVHLPLKEYKQLFNEATIAITTKGQVYYWTEKENVSYVTSYQLEIEGAIPSEIEILSDKSIKLISEDGEAVVGLAGFLTCISGGAIAGLVFLLINGERKERKMKN